MGGKLLVRYPGWLGKPDIDFARGLAGRGL